MSIRVVQFEPTVWNECKSFDSFALRRKYWIVVRNKSSTQGHEVLLATARLNTVSQEMYLELVNGSCRTYYHTNIDDILLYAEYKNPTVPNKLLEKFKNNLHVYDRNRKDPNLIEGNYYWVDIYFLEEYALAQYNGEKFIFPNCNLDLDDNDVDFYCKCDKPMKSN